MRSLIFYLAALFLVTTACRDSNTTPAAIDPGKEILGTVRFVNVEGGCWKIQGDDGKSYEPLNLPKEYRSDGLRVMFTASPPEEPLGSLCMVGILVHLDQIELVAETQ